MGYTRDKHGPHMGQKWVRDEMHMGHVVSRRAALEMLMFTYSESDNTPTRVNSLAYSVNSIREE